jgi:threonine dehydrogenase-like Zn-dependent dehydrogenase
MAALPQSHHALVLVSFDAPLQVQAVETPRCIPGSAVVEILSTPILSYASKLYSGDLKYPLHPPMTVGGGAIARVVSLGSDATYLRKGQLVFVDPMVRGRDDSSTSILLGVHGGLTSGAAVLMQGDWRHGSCARYARWPLENVHVLDEEKLTTSTSTSTLSLGLGYSFHDLAYLQRLLVPMGGLCESVLDVKVGDRVIVAPATGQFGGAAVEVALAMGADVVICGRNRTALTKMRDTLMPVYPGAKIDVVQFSGVVETDVAALQAVGDRGRPIDKYIDFSPAVAAGSTHITSCLRALKKGGKACLMGGITAGVEIPYSVVMFNDLQICGKFMYERDAVKRLISLVEGGRLKFRLPEIKVFGLKEWEKGLETAAQRSGWREMVVFEPGRE